MLELSEFMAVAYSQPLAALPGQAASQTMAQKVVL